MIRFLSLQDLTPFEQSQMNHLIIQHKSKWYPPNTHIFLLELDHLIGMALWNQGSHNLNTVHIKEEFRGKGYGSFLMKEIIRVLQCDITLEVYCDNGTAIRLYEKLGFNILMKVVSDEWPDYWVMKRVHSP